MRYFLMFAIVAFVFVSCNDDEVTIDDGGDSVSVEGNFRLTEFNTENGYDFNEDGTASPNLITETNCYLNETVVFNADLSGEFTSTSFAEIILEVDANDNYSYTVECIEETDVTAFTWTQSNNTVEVTIEGTIIEGTIDGNILVLVIPSGFTQEIEDGSGGSVVITEDLTFVYTRL
jgi:hypothetical protein